ncbi:NAD(P)/FAD-dependent oxidoreductase [Chloroflexota bacterium]
MGKTVHDITIIGAGIVGCSAALYLARAGQDVCVLEKGFIGGESSGRAAGGVRQNLRPLPELPLAMRTVQLWSALAEESDLDFEYRHHGNLALAWNDEEDVELRATIERQQAAGLECYYLSPTEVQAMVPGVAHVYLGGAYCPSDGYAEPYLSCLAWSRAAQREGAVFYEHREVTGLRVERDRIAAVETTGGTIATRMVINAAGAWAHLICRMVGVEIPARLCRAHLLVSEPLPRFLEPFLDAGEHGYFLQSLSGNVLSGWESRTVEGFDRRVAYGALPGAARRAASFMPRLRKASAIRLFCGFTCWTPDRLPLVGPLSHPEGFYMAAEFSGTGFAMGPVVSELLTQLILEGHTALPIERFRPERFGEA